MSYNRHIGQLYDTVDEGLVNKYVPSMSIVFILNFIILL